MDGVELANSICDTFQSFGDSLPPCHVDDADLTTPQPSPAKEQPSFTSLDGDLSKSTPYSDQGQKRPLETAGASPAGKVAPKQRGRQLAFPDTMASPPPTIESLSALIQSSISSTATTVANFTSLFDQKATADNQRLSEIHADVKKVIEDHGQRLDEHDDRITAVENLATEMQSKLNDLSKDAAIRSQCSSFPTREDPPPPHVGSLFSPPLSFSAAARSDVDQRVQLSREAEAQNAKTLVIFHARAHLGDLTDQEFAERAVGLFDGKHAKVVGTEWIGQGQIHLRVTLDQPVAEEVGRSFWKNARTYQVRYSLAPCHGVVYRKAINRMRAVLDTLRRYLELAGRRIDATSARFIGTDNFDAHKFLYPAIRLSDDRVIPISQILNNPHAPISFAPDPALDIPGPDASFRL